MELSGSRGPAATSLDPTIVGVPNGAGPMANVPAGGSPPGPVAGNVAMPSAAPGPAAYALPPQAMPQPVQQFNPMPQGVAELNAPAESILLTEMQDLKASFLHVRKLNMMQGAILFALGIACIAYLTHNAKLKINPPEVAAK